MTWLVIDAGSSSVRVIGYDAAFNIVHKASRPVRFTVEPAGAAVADASGLRQQIEALIDETLQATRGTQAAAIQAVGFATFAGNMVGVDASGQAVTPLFTYADTRSADAAAELRAELDETTIHQRTGCRLHTAYHPARLRWLQSTDITRQVARWLDFATYCYTLWFGQEVPCSYSIAAWSGLLNRASLKWDADLCAHLRLSTDQLPPLADYTAAQQGLLAEYAKRWPELADIPFFLALGDGAAAHIGMGAAQRGQLALTVGTTAALRQIDTSALPAVPDGLWSYRVDTSRHLLGGALSEGGSIFAWLRETLLLPELLDAALLERVPDSHGLTFLPLLAGERSPGWRGDATGKMDGLRLGTTPLDIAQAALEGVALRLALVAEQLRSRQPYILVGGGALRQSPAWGQLIADALGTPLHLVDEETTAVGAALLMRAALGTPLEAYMPNVLRVIAPRSEYYDRLRAARERQQKLYALFYD